MADFFDRAVDQGLAPDRFARLWCHTHPGTSVTPRVRKAINGATITVVQKVGMARTTATRVIKGYCNVTYSRLKNCCAGLLTLASLISSFRQPLFIALGVGTLVGVGCCYAGPVLASAMSGLAGFAGSLVLSALNSLLRMVVLPEPRQA